MNKEELLGKLLTLRDDLLEHGFDEETPQIDDLEECICYIKDNLKCTQD